jgi:hypothetical protein
LRGNRFAKRFPRKAEPLYPSLADPAQGAARPASPCRRLRRIRQSAARGGARGSLPQPGCPLTASFLRIFIKIHQSFLEKSPMPHGQAPFGLV